MVCNLKTISILEKACQSSPSSSSSSSSSSLPPLRKLLASFFNSNSNSNSKITGITIRNSNRNSHNDNTKARDKQQQQEQQQEQERPSVNQIQNLILLATKYNNTNAIFDILCFFGSTITSISKSTSTSTSTNFPVSTCTSNTKSLIQLSNDDDDNDDNSNSGDTLLHIMCREYGWNKCIELVLEYILLIGGSTTAVVTPQGGDANYDDADDDDDTASLLSLLFTFNEEMETPLYLACEYGCSPLMLLSSILRLCDQRHDNNNSFANENFAVHVNVYRNARTNCRIRTTASASTSASTSTSKSTAPHFTGPCTLTLSNYQHQLHFIKLISQFTSDDDDDDDDIEEEVEEEGVDNYKNDYNLKNNKNSNNGTCSNTNINTNNTTNPNSKIYWMLSTLLKINPKIISSKVTNQSDDSVDDHCVGQSALHWACYYQNPLLIEYCLLQLSSCSCSHSCSSASSCSNSQSTLPLPLPLELHLLLITKTRTTTATTSLSTSLSSSSTLSTPTSTARKTPLDYLIMNLGSCDDQYTWQCLDVFRRIYPNFPLLQYIIKNVNCHFISTVLLKNNILDTILKRYKIDLYSHGDENYENNNHSSSQRRSILVSAIHMANEWKMKYDKNCRGAMNDDDTACYSLFYDFCKYLLRYQRNNDNKYTINDIDATGMKVSTSNNALQYLSAMRSTENTGSNGINNNEKKHRCHPRLPLHIALCQNLTWMDGVSLLLNANIDAVEEVDTETNLPPFLLAAATTNNEAQYSGKDKKRRSKSTMTNCCGLDTIFELLRHGPTMIFFVNFN